MMVNDVDPDRLRRLAELRPDGGRVLSIYLDRDPETFASPRALMTETHSALDAATRQVEACASELDHDALVALRADVERVRDALLVADDAGESFDTDLDLKGARGLAVFACGPQDLFEILRLPGSVPTRVTVDTTAYIEPLVRVCAGRERIAVAIVDREHARLLQGTADAIEEVEDAAAELRHRQAREVDVERHVKAVSDELFRLLEDPGYDVLLLDARDELRGEVEAALHPYVRERLAGEELHVDLRSASPDDVRQEAARVLAERREHRVGELLARLREGLGRGERAAAGLEEVRGALEQRRVEALLYEATRELPQLNELVESAVLQDAEVLAIDAAEHPELGPHEGIGAVLRF